MNRLRGVFALGLAVGTNSRADGGVKIAAFVELKERGARHLILDIEGTQWLASEHGGSDWETVHAWPELCAQLAPARFRELPAEIAAWWFQGGDFPPPLRLTFYVCYRAPIAGGRAHASLRLEPSIDHWRLPATMHEYGEEFIRASKRLGYRFRLADEEHPGGWELRLPLPGPNERVGEALDRIKAIASRIHAETIVVLASRADPGSLVTGFTFPPERATACKQYLLYFVDFLRGLGISADAAVTGGPEAVLFSVTPQDRKEGLERVRQALGVYLRIVDAKVRSEDLTSADPAVRGLARNIAHAQGQGTTEEPLEIREAATSSALAGKLEKTRFWGGRITIRPLKHGPFEVDLPRIIEELKRKLPALRRLE